MAEPRELTRPPITEALVDIRIVPQSGITVEHLAPLRDELREVFPRVDEHRQFSGEFRIEEGKLQLPTSRDLGFHGLWLTSADGHRIVQLRGDGFTFNNVGLGHYLGGDALIDEALRLWSRYVEVVPPVGVTRLALRYLNRLEPPLRAGDEFSVFLTAPPALPDSARLDSISSFLSRIVAHDDSGAQVIVTQKLNTGESGGAILIDLDVSIEPEAIEPTSTAVRPHLETLRNLKNRAFFSLLTEETVKLYL